MIGALLLGAAGMTAAAVPADPGNRVFICQHFQADADNGSVREDLRIVQVGSLNDTTGQWTIQWPGQPPIAAAPFSASFGSVGGSIGLRWQDANGRQKQAYISFSDIHGSGKIFFWLSLDRPSLWQAPGYGCESQTIERSGAGE
jgi:hypothetical protein